MKTAKQIKVISSMKMLKSPVHCVLDAIKKLLHHVRFISFLDHLFTCLVANLPDLVK